MPGTVLGYTKSGRPIPFIGGGSDPAPAPTTDPAPAQPLAVPVPALAPAPAGDLGEAGRKALAEERQARKDAEKRLKELSDRLQSIEDKDKSELEKAQQRLAQFEKDLADERTRRLRLQAASEHGIPADYLDLLTGTDEAALKTQAEKLAALVKNTTSGTPAPLPGQGTPSTAPAASVAAGAARYQQKHQRQT
jgi:hypothetical protein